MRDRTKVFTFGGDDAEEEMLKTIAETTQAQYYHVAGDERIRTPSATASAASSASSPRT